MAENTLSLSEAANVGFFPIRRCRCRPTAAKSSLRAARPPPDAPIPTAGKPDRAACDLFDFIRVNSGGLAANAGLAGATQTAVEDEILIQRKYSLLYEGMRWVDMRRTGRINQVIKDVASDNVFSTLPVNSFEVQSRQ